MTTKKIKTSDILGDNYYIYELTSSSYTPALNDTITITCTMKDVYSAVASSKSITLYQNGTSKGAKTTNSNGVATWSVTCSSAGIQSFKVGNKAIEVFVDNKSDTDHTHSKSQITDFPSIPSKTSDLQNDSGFLTSHQSLSGYLQTSDVKDNLTSTDTNKPLSANQGKELKALIDNKEDNIYRIIGTGTQIGTLFPNRVELQGTFPFDSVDGKIIVYVVPDISSLSEDLLLDFQGTYPSGSTTKFNIRKSNDASVSIGEIQTGDELLLFYDNYRMRLIGNSSISGKIDTAGTGLSKSGTTLNHSNSVTALTTASFRKIKYDSQGHITGTTDVSANDLPSHNHTKSQITDFPQLGDLAYLDDITSHASSSTAYGVATSSNYGHTKVINNLTTSSNNNGEALSAYQGKVLNDNKVNKNDFNVDYVHSFPYNSTTEKYAYQGQSGALGIGVSAIDINDNSLLNEDGVAIIDLVFQNTNINYGSIQLVLAEADGSRYTDSSDLSNTQTIATITDTDKHHITIVVSPDTHIEEQTYDYYDLKVSNISYDDSNITVSSGKTSMERVGVYLVFNGAIGGNIEYMNVIKRTPIVNQIIDMIYPVGSTYISVNSVNPSFLFGGQWEQIQDRFLLASGSTYSAGSTGGSADAVVVSHNHTQSSHSHKPSNTSYKFLAATTNIALNGTKRVMPSSTNGSYHFVYAEDSTGGINEYETTSSVAPTINSNGVSGAEKNMPPYLTVYMWKRIA